MIFRKLRNKFVLTNLASTTIVLVAAYTSIYINASNTFEARQPISPGSPDYSAEVKNLIDEHVRGDRKESLRSLLGNLIITGVATEIIVVIISAYLAEESIKPVKESYRTQKLFIANASHEIKTPLAAIQANLEAADIEGNRWLDNVSLEVEKLSELNGKLLTLAKSDLSGSEEITTKEVNFEEEINKNLEPFEPMIRNKEIDLRKEINFKKTGKITLNVVDFSEIFDILLDNAIKYCDYRIWINANEKGITIKNDGTTIPEKQLSHVFDRFYQADKSKSGVGLGLAIAKSLAERNSWELSVASGKEFTEFTLTF